MARPTLPSRLARVARGLAAVAVGLGAAACAGADAPDAAAAAGGVPPDESARTRGAAPGARFDPPATHDSVYAGAPHGAPATITPVGSAPLVPTAAPETRPRKRLDVDQLRAAFLRTSGGLTWQDPGGADLFIALAPTLGAPDYIDSTYEDLSPSPLFHKFLDDAARDVCTRRVALDAQTPAAERVVLRHVDPALAPADVGAEAVEDNLRWLLERFHGHRVAPGDPRLEPWRWLVTTVDHADADVAATWRAVCVALYTHPDFYSY